MTDYTEDEIALAKKFRRITGYEPVGLLDTIRILTGPDMIHDFAHYVNSKLYPNTAKKN